MKDIYIYVYKQFLNWLWKRLKVVEIAVALAVEVAEAVDRVEVVVVVVEAAESSSSKTADLYKVSKDANTIYEKTFQVWKIR